MSNFLVDFGDEAFANQICSDLIKRGIEWSTLDENPKAQTAKSNRTLIVSSRTSNCDVMSSEFAHFLRGHNISQAYVFVPGQDQFYIETKLNNALCFVNVPTEASSQDNLSTFFMALFLEQFLENHINLPCGDNKTVDLVQLLCRLAGSSASVLINGPTGTGKEVVARLLHAKSSRKDAPFIAINCAAIPENMLESILFGHEKGAFTGAMQSSSGLFRAAHQGTVLLDEISEMPMGLQAKLLRVLQEKVVTPIGSSKEITIDVRVLATTNRNMQEEIGSGNFREDLFYRLNVFPISTLDLKSRVLDIPAISAHLLVRNAAEKTHPKLLSSDALDRLMQHDWPGNVRELDNVMQRAEILSYSDTIQAINIVFDNELITSPRNTMDALNSKLQARAL